MLHLLSHDIPYSVREQTSLLLVHDTTPTASAGPAPAAPNLRELVAPAGQLAEEGVLVRSGAHAFLLALYLGDDVGEGVVEAGEGFVQDVGVPEDFGGGWFTASACSRYGLPWCGWKGVTDRVISGSTYGAGCCNMQYL